VANISNADILKGRHMRYVQLAMCLKRIDAN